jgi:UDP-N-acetylglucosamine--N-acetylmuramyl-(pentapeptide) pyrophosphoryl-undecaprenol N-acetylglucosamine transferase
MALLVAGGTGGHIMPALAFGQWIRERRPGVEVRYLCGTRALELERYRASSIEPMTVDMKGSPLGAPKGRMLRRWLDVFSGYWRTRNLIRETNPDLCFMFGGYVSTSSVLICRRRRIPSVMHEQNAHAGKITRMGYSLGIPVASGWENCDPFGAGTFTPVGVPIRPLDLIEKGAAWDSLELPAPLPEGPIVVAMTGSLGSRRIKDIIKALAGRAELFDMTFVVVDPKALAPIRELDNLFLVPQRWNASAFYSVSDVVVARAGASTLSEITAMEIPAVMIPWSGAANDHQMKNAMAATNRGRFKIWSDELGDMSDLAGKLRDLQILPALSRGDTMKKMYNVAENICERLWAFAARPTNTDNLSALKGDDNIGG